MNREPKIFGGNQYYFLGENLRICWSCGFPIANNKSGHGKACRKLVRKDKNDLSQCEIYKNKHAQKTARAKDKEEGRKSKLQLELKVLTPKKNFKKRVCLRCNKLFKSEGKFNRVCGPCSNHEPAINTTGLRIAGSHIKIEGSDWH